MCRSGVFERGVLVAVEDEQPVRRVGRPKSVRGSVEVEEVVDDERETR